jgi:CheY-like chemotaxis protein
VAASLNEITDAAARARDLTRQLLAFARKQILEMREVDLNEVVRGFEKMLARLIAEDISVTTVLVPEIGKVRADPVQIEQIILNLAVNARDAMAGGGRLTIRTDHVDVGPGAPGGDLQVAPGRYVRLTVADTGSGMDAETQKHVFEPFFSTKEPGKGTGLGLATVFGIVQQHGGHIRLQSEVGKGSTFQVHLPRLQQPEGRVAARRREEAGLGGSETVLLVEDEVSVRRVLHRTLEGAGYRVLEVGDAPGAIRRAEEGPVDLLLTDVIIPGPSGRELHEALAAARPGPKVLFMSGYAEDVISSHGVLLPGIQFLQKRFSPGALLSKLREVLAAGAVRQPGPVRPPDA